MRGRAANPIRTGQWIKKTLLEVGESSVRDLHFTLRQEIKQLNEDRRDKGECAYRAPTYENFGKYFRNCRALGLVVLVSEEPAGGDLLSIKKVDGEAIVVPSTIRTFALTDKGRAEPIEGMWADPIKYMDQMKF